MTIERVPLGTYVKVVGGFAFKSEDFSDEGIPVIRISDLQNGLVTLNNVARIPTAKVGKGENYRVDPGDILVAMSGATTGKIGLAPSEFEGPILQNQRVGNFKIIASSKIDKRYLRHFVTSPSYQSQVWNTMVGVAQPNVSSKQLESFAFLLLPLPEQRRIAEVLDRAEALRAKRRAALAELHFLTQSIFLDLFGDPTPQAQRFPIQPLETLLQQPLQNGAYYPKESYTEVGGVEMVHMSDAFYEVVPRGKLKRVVSSEPDLEKYALSENDILIARRSLTLEGAAKPCRIPKSSAPLIFESSFIRVTPHPDKLTALYLYYYLGNERVKQKCVQPYITQSTISGINQSNLKRVPVIVPPLPLQREFARRVRAVEALKTAQRASLAELDALFASLQHRAFRGEL